MSFIGAVATSVRQVLAQYAKEVHLPCLIVGAGNFTVPSVLRSAGFPGTITACDVTLYTSALGAYLSGCTLEAREREDCPEHLRGLLRTGSPLELTASISLLMDLREVWKGDNAFKMRMVQHSREAWDTLMEKTCARLETYKATSAPSTTKPATGSTCWKRACPDTRFSRFRRPISQRMKSWRRYSGQRSNGRPRHTGK